MNASRILIGATVAALIAGAAVANDPYGKDSKKSSTTAGASFDSLDTNHDGRISRAEAAADSKIVFTTADTNGDGYLDSMEYQQASKAPSDSSMPPPRSQSESTLPNDTTGTDATVPPDQSAPPPSDTETPRQ